MEPANQALVTRLREHLEPRGEILEAYLFGSTARRSAQPHSDIDVAVYVVEPRPEGSPYGYAAELGTALMSALGTPRVDVALLNDASPLLYHRVLRDGVRIFRARSARDDDTRRLRAFKVLRLRRSACEDGRRAEGTHRSRHFWQMTPGQFDAAVVRRHLAALDVALQQVRLYAGQPLDILIADLGVQWAVERGLQLCAQNALDIATHLVHARMISFSTWRCSHRAFASL